MPGSLLRARWIIRGQPSLSCLETGSNENWPEEESKDVVVCPLEVSNSYSIPAGGDKAMDKIQSWPSKNLTSPKRDESFPYLLLDDILRQQVRQLSSSPFCRQRSPRSGEDTYRAHHQLLVSCPPSCHEMLQIWMRFAAHSKIGQCPLKAGVSLLFLPLLPRPWQPSSLPLPTFAPASKGMQSRGFLFSSIPAPQVLRSAG
ncbi:uncharacterized protein LOC106728513 isoform X4 [Camelus ferus]|uniref:Uncharacterized protein LOC106728513 isoform X4 n=1 Tax=Camelus ferus TaxID=419612 RepID=A0A8B8SDH1_CAMFR|nr:uncharacterized protein LOC106728513 isoform X4 [Camelus ferus]